jgi:ABC-type ATPase involved in cell division
MIESVMDLTFTGTYLSLQNIQWNDIPPLAILTGPNGTGKSQLLQLIYHALRSEAGLHPGILSNHSYTAKTVYLNPGQWSLQDSSCDSRSLTENFNNIFNMVQSPGSHNQHQYADEVWTFANDLHAKLMALPVSVDKMEFVRQQIPRNFYGTAASVQAEYLSNIFWKYHLDWVFATGVERKSPQDISRELCEPPWDVLNRLLRTADVDFSCDNPSSYKLDKMYSVRFKDKHNPAPFIPLSGLSSGEKVIISMYLWVFNKTQGLPFPKLLLLDEPDAYLHPSFTRNFFFVLNEFLIKQHGIHVIMTTHSPSTVSLAPADSIFEMKKTQPRIQKTTNITKTIQYLTSGFVTVVKGSRFVLVEDLDDQKFYSDALITFKDQALIPSEQSLVFIPSALREGREGDEIVGGGSTVVLAWTNKLAGSGLKGLIWGIIDKDAKKVDGSAPESDAVFKVDRYSIENYWLDPLVLCRAILDLNDSNHSALLKMFYDLNLRPGLEGKIGDLDSDMLQSIARKIIEIANYTPAMSNLSECVDVQYTKGKKLNLPRWLLEVRGKDLFKHFRENFGQRLIANHILAKHFSRLDVIPIDLLETLKKVLG